MSSTNRINIPENYQDWASSQLLIQPEPQYVYANMWRNAIGTALPDRAPVGLPGREIATTGAPYSNAQADRLMLEDRQISEEIFSVKVNFSKKSGDTVTVNRPSFVNYTATESSRRLTRGSSITTTSVNLQSEQTALTLFEYGGPYDTTNTRVAPFALEAFDAQFGIHDQPSIIGKQLKRDFHRFLDAWMLALLDNGTAIYSDAINFTTANDATSIDQFPMTYEALSRTCRTMDEASLPKFANGKRLFVTTPAGKQALVNDAQFARYAHVFKETNPLLNGMFGETDDWMLYVNNTLTITNNSSSIPIHTSHAIAPGVLGIGMGRPPRVAVSTDDDYQRSVKLIWNADLGADLMDNRFVYDLYHTSG